MNAHTIRLELFRLLVLLREADHLLKQSGVDDTLAAQLGQEARALAQRIAAARQQVPGAIRAVPERVS
jgi:hypothetical protein